MNTDWQRILETYRVFGVIDPDQVLAATAQRPRCLCYDVEVSTFATRASQRPELLHIAVAGCPEHGRRE